VSAPSNKPLKLPAAGFGSAGGRAQHEACSLIRGRSLAAIR